MSMMVLKQQFFVDLEKGLHVKAHEPKEDSDDSDEEYTMLLPDFNTRDSCVKKREEEKEQEKLEKERAEKAWRKCMICNIDQCTIL